MKRKYLTISTLFLFAILARFCDLSDRFLQSCPEIGHFSARFVCFFSQGNWVLLEERGGVF